MPKIINAAKARTKIATNPLRSEADFINKLIHLQCSQGNDDLTVALQLSEETRIRLRKAGYEVDEVKVETDENEEIYLTIISWYNI